MGYSKGMAEIKNDNHESWIEIVKYFLLYVAPITAAIWKITTEWSNIQKQKLAESLKDAVSDAVNPKFDAINSKLNGLADRQDKDREMLNNKIDAQNKEINNRVIEILREIRK